MNVIKTAHAVIISEDYEYIYGEKNKRFNDNFTFFGGKLEKGEDYKSGLLRELYEETGINFSSKVISILEKEESVIIGSNQFVGNLYLIHITKTEANRLLETNKQRNVKYKTDNIDSIPYGFQN